MNVFIYIFSMIFVMGIKIIYQYGDLKDLMFILKPVTLGVQTFLGNPFHYYEGIGFVNRNLGINIGKECSGINFLMMIFSILVFSFMNKIENKKNKLFFLFIVLFSSYMITIFANASRIVGIFLIMNRADFSDFIYERLLHQSIGILFYFTYFMIMYFIFYKMIKKWGDEHE